MSVIGERKHLTTHHCKTYSCNPSPACASYDHGIYG